MTHSHPRPRLWLPFLLALILAACSPSPPPTPTPTATPTSTPTITPSPTPTPTPSPSPTPTPTVTPSPTPDLRVIIEEPRTFLCTKDDLPPEGHYYLPASNWISPHRNYEILQSWGRENGQRYLDDTQRLDGWWAYYHRGTNRVVLPEYIFCNPIQYKTAQGAHIAFTQYNEVARGEEGYAFIETPYSIGDESHFIQAPDQYLQGQTLKTLLLEFRYRNYVIRLGIVGQENEIDKQVLLQIAQNILARLQKAELGFFSSETPTP